MTPAEAFIEACEFASIKSDHPHGGVSFLRRREIVCFARLKPVGERTVEIAGMYAVIPGTGGGQHVLSLVSLLADLYQVDLVLTAVGLLPQRKDTAAVVRTYERFGFVASAPDGAGRVPMMRRASLERAGIRMTVAA